MQAIFPLFPSFFAVFARFFCIFRLFHFHENQIIPDLLDIAKWNHIFFLMSEDSADASCLRNDQMFDTPGLRIEIEIPDKSEPFALADIDDFLSF